MATPIFRGQAIFNGINRKAEQPNRKCEIQDGGLQTGSTHISACRHARYTISTAAPMFSGSGYTTRSLLRLPDVWISCELKMASGVN